MKNKELMPLSASRLKQAKSCSFAFYSKYIQKIPEPPSSSNGHLLGGAAHDILEIVFKEKDRKIYNDFTKNGISSKFLQKIVKQKGEEFGVTSNEDFDHIISSVESALKYDFFGDTVARPFASFAELDFDIKKETPFGDFRILGFIDQLHLYNDGSALIRDFKTNKRIFEGEDASGDNLQNKMYTYAVRELYPNFKNYSSEFLFLKFDLLNGGVLKMNPVTEDEHFAFEIEIASWQNYLENFDEKDARSNFAKDQGYPDKNEGFCKKLMCGFGDYPNKLRKDGVPMYACSYKWPFKYLKLVDDKGNILKTAFPEDRKTLNEEMKKVEKKGISARIEEVDYGGCAAWNPQNY